MDTIPPKASFSPAPPSPSVPANLAPGKLLQDRDQVKKRDKTHIGKQKPPFECIALLLQGGGALGAYQAGVYEALAEAEIEPNWVAGISIGAINSAIIAGNAPKERVGKLKAFWEQITTNYFAGLGEAAEKLGTNGDLAKGFLGQLSATASLFTGAPGFFSPRPLSPFFSPDGTLEATSYYDTSALRLTLERLVDFDRINHEETRLSVGAVNILSGNFTYFDTRTHKIGPEHIMASGALPPGLPAVEIEGELYWDGGLISNTPLQWVTESTQRTDTLAFQVDLWSSMGQLPRNMSDVMSREKEIQFSSRTRENTDRFKFSQQVRNAIAGLMEKLPEEYKNLPEAQLLSKVSNRAVYNIVHLIYRSKNYEAQTKDYEFSRHSMVDHWKAGYHDTVRTLRHPEVLERPKGSESVHTFDLC